MGEFDSSTGHQSAVAFVLIQLLAIGALISFMQNRYMPKPYNIPYTVILFVVGALLRFISCIKLYDPYTAWSVADGQLILFIFLPILIFCDSMNMVFHEVKFSSGQAMLLAGPGVVLQTFLMGFVALYLTGRTATWNYYLSMVFGSILSSTDPVSVISLMKSCNVSSKLTLLITGESILNDGVAMIMYTLFYAYYNGASYTSTEVVAYFFKMLIISPFIGLLVGLISIYCIGKLNRIFVKEEGTRQIALTLISAYVSYYISGIVCQLSGILACYTAGIVFCRYGKPLINHPETMSDIWEFLEWIANTCIFLLAGLILGSTLNTATILNDLGCLLLLYTFLILSRAAMIFTLYPIFRKIGYDVSINEAIFMCWSGLRGALVILLSLIVRLKIKHGGNGVEADRFFFFAGGLAFLTLLINATTCEYLLHTLGLISVNEDRQELQRAVRRRLATHSKQKLDHILQSVSPTLDDEFVREINQYCSIFGYEGKVDSDGSISDGSCRLSLRGRSSRVSALMTAGARPSTAADVTFIPSRSVHQFRRNSIDTTSNTSASNRCRSPTTVSDISGRLESGFSYPFADDIIRTTIMSHQKAAASVRNIDACYDDDSFGVTSTADSNPTAIKAGASSGSSNKQLQGHIRSIYLEIVRAEYMHYIQIGKITRKSYVSQLLLFTIDAARDDAVDKFTDWVTIKNDITQDFIFQRRTSVLMSLYRVAPAYVARYFQSIVNTIWYRKEARCISLLTNYINAHENGIERLHNILGTTDDIVDISTHFSLHAKEEVIAELHTDIQEAKNFLKRYFDDKLVSSIITKQVSYLILNNEAQMVKEYVAANLLSPTDAENFFNEINADKVRLALHRQQMHLSRQISQQEASDVRHSFTTWKQDLVLGKAATLLLRYNAIANYVSDSPVSGVNTVDSIELSEATVNYIHNGNGGSSG